MQKQHYTQGFTLVEMMVSITIFTIVLMSGIGMLYSVSDAYSSSRARGNAITALGVSMESMSRQIRTGAGYDCDPSTSELDDCTLAQDGGSNVTFLDQEGRTITYSYSSGEIKRTCVENLTYSGECIGPKDENGKVTVVVAKTAGGITISSLVFYVTGSDDSDNIQPTVSILIRGTSTFRTVDAEPFALQTTVVQRIIDDTL